MASTGLTGHSSWTLIVIFIVVIATASTFFAEDVYQSSLLSQLLPRKKTDNALPHSSVNMNMNMNISTDTNIPWHARPSAWMWTRPLTRAFINTLVHQRQSERIGIILCSSSARKTCIMMLRSPFCNLALFCRARLHSVVVVVVVVFYINCSSSTLNPKP